MNCSFSGSCCCNEERCLWGYASEHSYSTPPCKAKALPEALLQNNEADRSRQCVHVVAACTDRALMLLDTTICWLFQQGANALAYFDSTMHGHDILTSPE